MVCYVWVLLEFTSASKAPSESSHNQATPAAAEPGGPDQEELVRPDLVTDVEFNIFSAEPGPGRPDQEELVRPDLVTDVEFNIFSSSVDFFKHSLLS